MTQHFLKFHFFDVVEILSNEADVYEFNIFVGTNKSELEKKFKSGNK